MNDFIVWVTQRGEKLLPSNMNEVHIQNCMNMLHRNFKARLDALNEEMSAEVLRIAFDRMIFHKRWIKIFEKELQKRVDKAQQVCYNNNINQNIQGGSTMRGLKATGIVRRIDDLGRVVIPKEIRRSMRIREGAPLEFFRAENGDLVIRSYDPDAERNRIAEQMLDGINNWRHEVRFLRNGNTMICTSAGKVGMAVCNTADEFNETIGKAIAFRRMRGLHVPRELIED